MLTFTIHVHVHVHSVHSYEDESSCSCFRFYHTNNVKQFVLKRPFHIGKKDKMNEYKV